MLFTERIASQHWVIYSTERERMRKELVLLGVLQYTFHLDE